MAYKWHQPGGVRGDWSVTGAFLLPGAITTSLSGNVDDWAPTGLSAASAVVISATASADISGIDASSAAPGRLLLLTNAASAAVRREHALLHESASSSALNRIACPNDADYSLVSGDSVWLQYQDTTGSGGWRWRVLGRIAAAAAADVSIADAGGHFTATDVEGALQELGASGGGGGDSTLAWMGL